MAIAEHWSITLSLHLPSIYWWLSVGCYLHVLSVCTNLPFDSEVKTGHTVITGHTDSRSWGRTILGVVHISFFKHIDTSHPQKGKREPCS